MAWTWVYIANLMGPPGDANAMGRFTAIEAKNTEQDSRLDDLHTKDLLQDADLLALEPRLLQETKQIPYAIPFVDKDGYVAGGFAPDAALHLKVAPNLPSSSLPIRAFGKDTGFQALPMVAGWAWAIPDNDGYVAFGVRATGEIYAPGITQGATRSSRTRIVASGDSLTAGGSMGSLWPDSATTSWPARLQAALTGVTVFNRGTSGATVDEVNIRSGAKKLYLFGSIPESGPATLTTKQDIAWYPSRTASIRGSLAGVPGTLAATTTGLVFTRDSPGAAVTATGQALVSEWDVHAGDTLIVMMGRNDINPGLKGNYESVADHIVAGYVEAVNHLSPHYTSFVVVGPVPETDEVAGSASHNAVLDIGKRLKALYPANHANLHRYLVDQAMTDMGLTPNTADTAAIAADTLPPSIMDDNTHYSRATCQVIGEQFFAPLLTKKGLV